MTLVGRTQLDGRDIKIYVTFKLILPREEKKILFLQRSQKHLGNCVDVF